MLECTQEPLRIGVVLAIDHNPIAHWPCLERGCATALQQIERGADVLPGDGNGDGGLCHGPTLG